MENKWKSVCKYQKIFLILLLITVLLSITSFYLCGVFPDNSLGSSVFAILFLFSFCILTPTFIILSIIFSIKRLLTKKSLLKVNPNYKFMSHAEEKRRIEINNSLKLNEAMQKKKIKQLIFLYKSLNKVILVYDISVLIFGILTFISITFFEPISAIFSYSFIAFSLVGCAVFFACLHILSITQKKLQTLNSHARFLISDCEEALLRKNKLKNKNWIALGLYLTSITIYFADKIVPSTLARLGCADTNVSLTDSILKILSGGLAIVAVMYFAKSLHDPLTPKEAKELAEKDRIEKGGGQ